MVDQRKKIKENESNPGQKNGNKRAKQKRDWEGVGKLEPMRVH